MRISDMARKMARYSALVRGVWYSLVAEMEGEGAWTWDGTAEELCRVLSCTMAEVMEFLRVAWSRRLCLVSADGATDGEFPDVSLKTMLSLTVPELRDAAQKRVEQRRRTAECRARKRNADSTRKCNADVTQTMKNARSEAARTHACADVCEEEFRYDNITHTPSGTPRNQDFGSGRGCVCGSNAAEEKSVGCVGIRPYPKTGEEVRRWVEAYRPDAATAMTPQRCQEFVDFGEATGWTVGSTTVRDWTKMISGKWLRPGKTVCFQTAGRLGAWDPRRDFSGDYSRSEGAMRLFKD